MDNLMCGTSALQSVRGNEVCPEESMDTDGAVERASVEEVSATISAEQCSETEMMVGYCSSIRLGLGIGSFYNVYDKNYTDTSFTNTRITNFLESKFRSLEKYEVKEPLGYGLLMGCKGPENFASLSPAVYRDVSNMEEALKKSGSWTTRPVRSVLKRNMLQNELDLLRKKDFGEFSIFLLFYSGHGNRKGVILDDNYTFFYSGIVECVASIDSLKNKPKIFIFDCCRGNQNQQRQDQHQDLTNCSPFYQELQQMHCNEHLANPQGYPPPHTLICYSATDNCYSQLHGEQGSFYTIALSHALKQFGKHFSLLEIITQVNGYTRAVNEHYFDKNSENYVDQRPIFMSNLDKHLVLNVRSNEEDKDKTDAIMEGVFVMCSMEESRLHLGTEECVFKGLDTPNPPQEGGRSLVHLLRDVEVKSEWKSRDEIEQNLHSLGDGISVFFIYAPNPDNPYKKVSSHDPLEQRNRYLMCRLFFDLERHGFHVVSDLHLGDTEPANWLKWYITRILHCHFVIFVCSPAFKELFQETPCVDKIVNDKARRLLEYSNAIYSGISRELSRADGRRKFFPVILDNYEVRECVPDLFQSGNVFHIKHEELPRKFDYNDKSRDFEKLVCYMAGINRMKLEQPTKGVVTVLGDPFEIRRMELILKGEKQKRLLEGPPRGYITAEELKPPSNLVGQPPTGFGRVGMGGATMPVGRSPSSHLQASIPIAPQVQPHVSSQLSTCVDPSSLPLKVPKRNIYLWLSGEIMSWKFIARHLGLQESDIERITSDYDGMVEHRFQMFRTWEQHSYDDCSYRRLGEVLMNSEKNCHLYKEYVRRVYENEQIS